MPAPCASLIRLSLPVPLHPAESCQPLPLPEGSARSGTSLHYSKPYPFPCLACFNCFERCHNLCCRGLCILCMEVRRPVGYRMSYFCQFIHDHLLNICLNTGFFPVVNTASTLYEPIRSTDTVLQQYCPEHQPDLPDAYNAFTGIKSEYSA